MDKTATNTSGMSNGMKLLLGAALAAAAAIVGWGWWNDSVERDARRTLLNRIAAPDNTPAVCKTSITPRTLTKTLAPLFDLHDANTGLRGQTLVAHALNRGVDFVVCDDMINDTATFEKQPGGYVLKLNAQANDLQQQAAALQLMKEFYNTGASYATITNGGQKITADVNLVRSMPGRILEEHDIADRIEPKLRRDGGFPVRIPMRSFAGNTP